MNRSENTQNNIVWRPSASRLALQNRAILLTRLRDYFAREDVLEVETPLLASAGVTDPHIASFTVPDSASGQHRYLNTSPEFAMKRLLAADMGAIYQVCKAFRREEQGRHHNAEFTLLEWYRPGFDDHHLMRDLAALMAILAEGFRQLGAVEYLSYHDCFQQFLGVNPHTANAQLLAACAREQGLPEVSGLGDDRDAWLDLLMSFYIQPKLGCGHLCFLYDYPESQAALARVRPGNPAVAERFELFLDGIELANGFHELQESDEQRRRFEADLAWRKREKREAVTLDERLLAALSSGLPACAGVALGLDRVQMVLTGVTHIESVLAFDYTRS
jgi:elongation factor P--(R)-beta-lysine ligase